MENSLKEKYPNLCKEWDYNKNKGITPESISYGSQQKVWWICAECGYSWKALVRNRTLRNCGCPHCKGRVPIIGTDDFATIYPEIAKEWDYNKNNRKPNEFRIKSNFKAWWICSSCGYSYEKSIDQRTYQNQGCPNCSKWTQTSFPEQAIFYYIKKIFPDAINRYKPRCLKPYEIDIFIPNLNIGIEYDGKYFHKNNKNDLCKFKKCKENNIVLVRIKDGQECNIEDSDITILVEKPWNDNSIEEGIVELFNYLKIDSSIISLERDKTNIISLYKNNIIEKSFINDPKFVLLKEEWDCNKNIGINPEGFSSGSKLKVWWKCKKCGHSWQTTIKNRTLLGCGCPLCSGNVVIHGKNDLFTTNPYLEKYWSINENDDPKKFSRGSNYRAWWICPKCGKVYKRSIKNQAKEGCLLLCKECLAKEIGNIQKKKVLQFTKDNIYINSFDSIKDAAKEIGIKNENLIRLVCKGKKKSAYGFIWKYADG